MGNLDDPEKRCIRSLNLPGAWCADRKKSQRERHCRSAANAHAILLQPSSKSQRHDFSQHFMQSIHAGSTWPKNGKSHRRHGMVTNVTPVSATQMPSSGCGCPRDSFTQLLLVLRPSTDRRNHINPRSRAFYIALGIFHGDSHVTCRVALLLNCRLLQLFDFGTSFQHVALVKSTQH